MEPGGGADPVARRGGSLLPFLFAAVAVGCGDATPSEPGTVRVAVAANFGAVQAELARRFEERTGYRVRASPGATGQLYAQIRHGAPYDVLLAADAERPRLLEEEGLGVPGSRFTYATGRLALYGPTLDSVRPGGADLRSGFPTHLAIANPRIAPYGAAAEQVLARLGLAAAVRPRIVQGESIAQTHQFVRSGAAEMGFVALSQVVGEPRRTYWLVPEDHHAPILQDAVLLRRGEQSAAARAYLRFLRSEEARRVIESHGYMADGRPDP